MGDIDKVKRSYRKEQQVHDYEPIGFDYNGEVIAQVWSKVLGYQGIVYVQKYSGPDVENKLNLVRRLRHYNLIDVLGIFYDTEDVNKASVTFEFMPVVVIDLCEQTSTHLQELTLAAIVAQVCQGLTFLENAKLQNTLFNKSRVLADLNGNVKLRVDAACEPCYYPPHLLAFTQHVMFPWKLCVNMTEIENKWPEDSDAMDFWNTLPNATTMGDVVKRPLLALPWRTDHVKELIGLALWQGSAGLVAGSTAVIA